jgi:hypothetical protein
MQNIHLSLGENCSKKSAKPLILKTINS